MVSNLPRKKLPKCNPKPLNLCYDGLISVPLCLGVFVLNSSFCIFSALSASLRFNRICIIALSAASSLISAATTPTIEPRRTHPSHPLQLRQFGGISRVTRRHKLSIQRLAPSHPPVISVGNLQNLHNLRILCIIFNLPPRSKKTTCF